MMYVIELRCQVPLGVLAIGREPVRLTWRVAADDPGLVQEAWEVEVSASAAFDRVLHRTGPTPGSAQVAVTAGDGPLTSREVRWYRVRIRTQAGWTDWSPSLRVEAGLLEADDWVAEAITLAADAGADHQAPSPLLRHEFELAGPVADARLYLTSLGVHDVRINDRPVTDALLSPGWTPYHRRLLAETWDVTPLLQPGRNAIAAALGDGWYRGRLGWDPAAGDRCRYGTQLGLVAQLEMALADGTRQRVVTGPAWRAATGSIGRADLYDGCLIDLREEPEGWTEPGFDDSGWAPVAVVPLDRSLVEPRVAPPVRPIAVLPVTQLQRPGGRVQLDGGQNISGVVRLRVRGTRGDQVTVRHAEVLEPDGSLHTRSLRSAAATDTWILARDGETELEPRFTFHGFRYAEVETPAQIVEAQLVAISSDTPPRATFSCAEPRLERLVQNVVWSQRDNFVSVPTDCPQRDERLGWTGDAQAFAATASTLFDAEAFWRSWLRDLALEQDDVLGAPTVVPDVVITGEARFGRAGWADAATIVPWAVAEASGDDQVLRDQLPSMQRWIASLVGRLGPDGLLPPSMQFGDWLDPDAPVDRPWEAKADSTYLANAFFVHSARLAADAADQLGEGVWAAETRQVGARLAQATWSRWRAHALTTQTGCAVALRLGVAPPEDRWLAADALAALVRSSDGAVRTGFLGTPLVLPALADAGRFAEAYRMLLRTAMPSWLYQVEQGATTIWERWDAIRPDGSIHPGTMSTPPEMAERTEGEPHMLSFNHYAYGAVVDWVFRHVAGLASVTEQPGYRHVRFAPRPATAMRHAAASVDSAYGRVAIDWLLDAAGDLRATLELPFGTTGTFAAPGTDASRLVVDGRDVGASQADLGPGRHEVWLSAPAVVEAAPGDA